MADEVASGDAAAANTTHHSDQPFRFLDLPPELRNRIYDCIFVRNDALAEVDILETKTSAPPPAIMITCHQIRKESLGLFSEAKNDFFSNRTLSTRLKLYAPRTTAGMSLTQYYRDQLRAATSLADLPIQRLEVHLEFLIDAPGPVGSRKAHMLFDASAKMFATQRIEDGQDYHPAYWLLKDGSEEPRGGLRQAVDPAYVDVGTVLRDICWVCTGISVGKSRRMHLTAMGGSSSGAEHSSVKQRFIDVKFA